MRIKTSVTAAFIFLVIFGGIGTTMALGLWTTTSSKVPVKITEGEYAGSYNPADIRGSYTFEEVANSFEIDLQVLYKAFNIPSSTPGDEIQTKDLEGLYEGSGYEIGNESVQVFVALYKNLPIILDETYLPIQAVELILHANPNLSNEQKLYMETHSATLTEASTKTAETINPPADNATATPAPSEKAESESAINGTSTFQNVLDAGATKAEIENVLKAPMPPTNQKVKDYCVENEISFSEVKEQLSAFVN